MAARKQLDELLLLLRSRSKKEKNLQVDALSASPQLPDSLDFNPPYSKTNYLINATNTNTLSNRKMKIRRSISWEEMDERRSKGLCMFCDESETPDHYLRHKNSGILMIDSEDHLSNAMKDIEVEISSDMRLSNAIGCETDSLIENNQLIQEQAKNHSTDSIMETSLLQHKDSLLKVSISHLEFSHRFPIESLEVYEDLSAIVRSHCSMSQFDLECAASTACQVFDSMPLRTKLLQNLRKKTFSKTWWFKFKEDDVRQEDLQNVLLAFLHMNVIETGYLTAFKHVRLMRLMRQTHMSQLWCEVWLRQTLQDPQKLTFGEVQFQIKHKWRSKFLNSVSELVLCFDSAELSTSYANSWDCLWTRESSIVRYEYSIWEQNDKGTTKLLCSRRLVVYKRGSEAKAVAGMYQCVDQLIKLECAKVK